MISTAGVILIAGFLAITVLLGFLGYKNTHSTADYLVGGRKMHPFVMALSYGATFISTAAIIGFGGAAAVFGLGIMWLTALNIFIGIFIAYVFFGTRTRTMGQNLDAHTFPELLGKRYGSQFLQNAAGFLIFFTMPLYAGSVIIGGITFIVQSTGIGYDTALLLFTVLVAVYVVFGGLKGVMYADAFQGAVMFCGMLFLLVYTYIQLGGFTEAHRALTEMKPDAIAVFGARGHLGWTSMPAAFSPFWWQLVSSIILGVGIGVLAQPQLVVRFMSVQSSRELTRALAPGAVFILVMTGTAYTVGALSNVYFMRAAGKISIAAAEGKTDSIMPLFITQAMPSWFIPVFFITLIAAAMSTLSSQFHTIGTALGRDVLENKIKIHTSPLLVNRICMCAGIVFSAGIAYILPRLYTGGTAIIAAGTALFFGICAAAFLPMYIGTLYLKCASRSAAIASFFSGITVSLFWILFVHEKEAAAIGLCTLLTGKAILFPMIAYVNPIVAALPVSAIVYGIVTANTNPVEEETVQKAFQGL